MDLVERIGLRKSNTTRSKCKWDDPETSIGERLGTIRSGKYTCWKPVGRAREAWNAVRPTIKEYLDNFCPSNASSVILEVYMIGKTEATAYPTILICSSDKATRKTIRKQIVDNGFLDPYPGFGLGDTTELPDRRRVRRMAGRSQGADYPNPRQLNETGLVYTSAHDTSILGRRLVVVTKSGSKRRTGTGGPVLWINGRSYQLTVAHVLEDDEEGHDSWGGSFVSDDCSFDADSDEEESADEISDLEVLSIGSRTPEDRQSLQGDDDCQGEQSTSSLDTEDRLLSEGSHMRSQIPTEPAVAHHSESRQTSNEPHQSTMINTNTTAPRKVGKVFASSSDGGSRTALDYALVELDVDIKELNTIRFQRYGAERVLNIAQVAEIGPHDVDVVAWTASQGIVQGRLSAVASYMRLPNQRTFQGLFLVQLADSIGEGDCGAAVIDQVTGEFYGHIVAGTPGTGLAYLVSGTQVFQDIRAKLGVDVELTPTIASTTSAEEARVSAQTSDVEPPEPRIPESRVQSDAGPSSPPPAIDPPHITTFASERYFEKLHQLNTQRSQVKSPADNSDPPSSGFILPLREAPASARVLGKEKAEYFSKSMKPERSPLWKLRTAGWKLDSTPQRITEPSTSLQTNSFLNQLPSEIQLQILEFLGLSDILTLRLTSRAYYETITHHENALARHIAKNHIPSYTLAIYPPPEDTNMDMHYVCDIWSRVLVATKFASLAADYITEDIFLRKTESQRVAFASQHETLCRRLIPILFVVFHFLENYRQRSLDFIIQNGHGLSRETYTINPIEAQIMQSYDPTALLRTHEAFPIIMSFFIRKLRPPTYVGRVERSLRGYLKDRVPDEVCTAIICIGGLRQMTRITEVKGYNTRRDAVDTWYSSLVQEADTRPRAATSVAIAEDRMFGRLMAKMKPRKRTADSSKIRPPLPISSLAKGPPMGQLTPEHIDLLLQNLPPLRDLWMTTAEAVLLSRGAIKRPQDIKRNQVILLDLIREEETEFLSPDET